MMECDRMTWNGMNGVLVENALRIIDRWPPCPDPTHHHAQFPLFPLTNLLIPFHFLSSACGARDQLVVPLTHFKSKSHCERRENSLPNSAIAIAIQ